MDPRHEVTDVAFRVEPKLLGTELATPWRRALALCLDLGFASFGSSFGLSGILSWLAASFIYRKLARSGQGGRRFLASMAAGSAFLVGVTYLGSGSLRSDEDDDPAATSSSTVASAAEPDLEILVESLSAAVRIFDDPRPEAYGSTTSSASSSRPPSHDELDAAIRELVAGGAELVDASMEERIEELEERIEELEEHCDEAAESGASLSVVEGMRALAADFGLTFTWVGFYFILFTRWWNGSTPAKRLLGIRIRRLDGQRITWWLAFERFGGYGAGLATGLLGFVQVFWDANRQAIHDKIASTVVIRERRKSR